MNSIRNKSFRKICAVIPAAGRGSRLGMNIPKILLPIAAGKTVWNILYDKLRLNVNQIHVVVSPEGQELFKRQFKKDGDFSCVSMSVQKKPLGMGDAIFGAFEYWKDYDNILILWGDQVFISNKTIQSMITYQLNQKSPSLTMPVSLMKDPYVQYMFAYDYSRLISVRQTREGDACDSSGFTDTGAFCLSTVDLKNCWRLYLNKALKGRKTGEINFLPFLPYLSDTLGWNLKILKIKDPAESRGINTKQDLIFFRRKFSTSNKRHIAKERPV